MKRQGNLYEKIISISNLELADINARKGKSKQSCIKKHDKEKELNIEKLHFELKNKSYKTSEYKTFTIDPLVCHPTWNVQYLDTFNNKPPIKKTTASQRRYRDFLRSDSDLSFKQWLGIR